MTDIIEAAARALYLRWFPDAPVDEHFQWYHDGAANPDSCVHSSNVAKALKDAAAVAPLIEAAALERAAKVADKEQFRLLTAIEPTAAFAAQCIAEDIRALILPPDSSI